MSALLSWLFLLLLCCSQPSFVGSQQCGQCDADAIDLNVELSFLKEGDGSFIEYTDSQYGELRVEVPRFFFNHSKERILREIHYSFQNSAWSERALLEIFYYAVTYGTDHIPDNSTHTDGHTGLESAENWLVDCVDICQWDGIVCGPLASDNPLEREPDYKPPCRSVTSIDLMEAKLSGTLPPELFHLSHLHRLNLNDNFLHGTIPTTYGNFEHLRFIDLGNNELTGVIPHQLGNLAPTLEELWLEKNYFDGPLDYALMQLTNCQFMDLSSNKLTGTMPPEIGHLSSLSSLFLEENKLTGTICPELGLLRSLRVIDIGVNEFTGPIPSEIGLCSSLVDFNVGSNRLNESIPAEIFYLTNLEALVLSENELTGDLPEGDDKVPGRVTALHTDDDKQDLEYGFAWGDFTSMVVLALDRNNFIGTLPPQLLWGLAPTLTSLDIGYNFFTGTIPHEIGEMTLLKRFTAPYIFFMGPVPSEIGRMKELWMLNLTANLFTGTIPKYLCGEQLLDKLIVEEYGCDGLLCPPGTFQPSGAATVVGGCQPCPKTELAEEFTPKLSTVLGRSSCESSQYLVADQNVDGVVSPREALRFLYFELQGDSWGEQFLPWRDLKVKECDLAGITCTNGKVTKIDLSEADVCSDSNGKALEADQCLGIPGEIRFLNASLEEFHAPHRRFMRTDLPSELGELTNLKVLDLQGCPFLTGTIPTEFGRLTKLQHLDFSDGDLNGTLPSEMFGMTSLEKINLSLNPIKGSLPSEIGNLKILKELRLSRASLNGTLPSSLGDMQSIENLEIYGNEFTGSIPTELGKLLALKRIDLFNNILTGPIPDTLGNIKTLQILHFKKNELSGEIPSSLGELSSLVWLDASLNLLTGTIPSSFGTSPMLKDLRLHGNRLYDPIPPSLCSNHKLNGGSTVKYGCDGIICPLGTFSPGSQGFAQESARCEKCPSGQTTLYLGSTECIELNQADLLSMLFDVLDGDHWPEEFKKGWKEENVSICDWAGVTCNEKEEIIGLAIPLSQTD